jgi:hypothetical protein
MKMEESQQSQRSIKELMFTTPTCKFIFFAFHAKSLDWVFNLLETSLTSVDECTGQGLRNCCSGPLTVKALSSVQDLVDVLLHDIVDVVNFFTKFSSILV